MYDEVWCLCTQLRHSHGTKSLINATKQKQKSLCTTYFISEKKGWGLAQRSLRFVPSGVKQHFYRHSNGQPPTGNKATYDNRFHHLCPSQGISPMTIFSVRKHHQIVFVGKSFALAGPTEVMLMVGWRLVLGKS